MAPYVSSRNTPHSIAGRVQAPAGAAGRRARPVDSQSARPPKEARDESLITQADFERAQDDFRSQAGYRVAVTTALARTRRPAAAAHDRRGLPWVKEDSGGR
jgi:hypothetical protein